MEDLIGIVVLILYLVAVGAAGKNKKKKKAQKKTASRREAQFEQAFERMLSSVVGGTQHRTEEKPFPKRKQLEMEPTHEGADPCHESMLAPERRSVRLSSVSQEQMHAAQEGEDPCHPCDAPDGDILQESSPVYRSPIFDTEDQDAFARDILRGIVMSEVLARPSQRRLGGGMKRGA